MHLTPDNRLKKLIVIGDRVLIKLQDPMKELIAVCICRLVCMKKKKYSKVI